ncbi:MAG: cysteine desulfurase [Pseudomonadota bacterium]
MTVMSRAATAPGEEAAMLHVSAVNDYDLTTIRQDFPILSRTVYDKPLVYLDSAASAQKPRAVIETVDRHYREDYANVHRGLHNLSMRSTELYEAARETIREHIKAASTKEIVFTKGATEGINLVASSFGAMALTEGDEIVISNLEHHSNIVPWQLLAQAKGLVLKVAPVDEDANFLFDDYLDLLTDRTKLVAITATSNAVGTITPIEAIVAAARERGIATLVDGTQAVVHGTVDVQSIGCDFLVFSSHKLYGPSGAGVLYGREALLDEMPPYQAGGEMIRTVSFSGTSFADLPTKFEAGTPPITQAIGMAAAIDYLNSIGFDRIMAHEADLLAYATERLEAVEGVTVIGQAERKASIISFTLDDIHPHDIGTLVDRYGVAVRAGHHCAQPLMERFDLPATARASFALYNSRAEADRLAEALEQVKRIFA